MNMASNGMSNSELLSHLDRLRAIMIAVATGGPRIQKVEHEFLEIYDDVAQELERRGIGNPLPYRDLWDWYGRWSSGDFPSWRSRRQFVSDIFAPLIKRIQTGIASNFEPTGWQRVDRAVTEIRTRIAQANVHEQYQAIGLLCREALISLAQQVYDENYHISVDGVAPSSTDAKRMIEAYIAFELRDSSNEFLRKHARAALDLANHLQHKRTATFRDAALCVEATTSLINLITIVAGLRDPEVYEPE